jgi:hypothetical protein
MLNKLFKIHTKFLQLLILFTLPQVIYHVVMSWQCDTLSKAFNTFYTYKHLYTCKLYRQIM